MIYNKIPKTKRFKWCTADTETYTLIDGQNVSTDELNALALNDEHNVAWFRTHASIITYAWQISVGEYEAICDTFDEWLTQLSIHNISVVWFYNAKFDFSQIDYQILSCGKWQYYDSGNEKIDGVNYYNSLHSAYGQRYQYTLYYQYVNSHNKLCRHKIMIYDLMNIFTGGLKNLLINFDVRDKNDNELRKLEMDYQNNKDVNGNFTDDAIKYMLIDVKGLYYLIEKCDAYISNRYQMHLLPKPEFMTAGGFAKRLLLETLYEKGDYKDNINEFHKHYVMYLEYDKMIREGGLYQGGKCFVNYEFQNKLIDKKFGRYDYNSHYPARMRESIAFEGIPYKLTYDEYVKTYDNEKYIYILHLETWNGTLKPKMLPVWYDYQTKKYTSSPYCIDDKGLLIFEFELKEYEQWYDLDYNIDYVIRYKKVYNYKYRDFVDNLYKDKTEGKKTKNKCQEMFAKLGLNSSYGKFAQNPYQPITHREISEETGAVHLLIDGVETDEKSLMSVIQGAYITARGRVELCKSIRTLCINSPIEDFYYCDTDSIHGNFKVSADAYKIGELKEEGICKYGLFLAPKTYFEVMDDDTIEIHSKGIPITIIYNALLKNDAIDKDKKVIDINKCCNVFKAGNKFQCLCAMNLRGGKGLIPLFKELCKTDNTRMYTSNINDANYELYEI